MPSKETSSPTEAIDWEGLGAAADLGCEFRFRSPSQLREAGIQQLSLGDRIAQRCFSGTIPLFLLTYTALILSTWHDGMGAMALNFPTAVLLTWLLRPFLQSAGRTCLRRYSLMVLPVLVLSWPAPLLPEAGLNYLKGKDWHLEFIPAGLQRNMESSLQVSHFFTYLLLALATALVLRAVQNRFYWIEVASTPRSALLWRSLFWILPLVLLSLVFWRDLTPTEAELEWSRQQKEALAERPFAGLPLQGKDEYWRSILKRTAPSLTLEHYDHELEKVPFQRVADSSQVNFASHPPSSGFELRACERYYLLLAVHSRQPELHFQGIELALLRQPDSASYTYWAMLLQSLGRDPLDRKTLESWNTRLEQLRQIRLSREEELDISAYQSLLRREVHAAYVNWGPDGHLHSELSALKSRDLQVLGTDVSFSPSRFYFEWQAAKLRREWLQEKPGFLERSLDDQDGFCRARQNVLLRNSYAGAFWGDLPFGQEYNADNVYFRAAEVILSLREYSLEHGGLPESLEGLVDRPEEYRWERRGKSGFLTRPEGFIHGIEVAGP